MTGSGSAPTGEVKPKLPDERPSALRRLAGQLYVQVLAAIILGALIGHVWPSTGEALKPLGDAFIRLVKMVIAPVIFLTVVTGIAHMSDLGKVGALAIKAFTYFIVVSTLALILGMVVANVVQPGAGMNIDPATLDTAAVSGYASKAHDETVTGFLMNIIPESAVGAFIGGNLLQVLFLAIPFGVALTLLGERAAPARVLLDSLAEIFFKLVAIFMRAAPIGAFGAFAFTVGKYGIGTLVDLGLLVATFYLTSAFFILVVVGSIARFNGFSIIRLIVYLKAEVLLVLGTCSTESALPSLMQKLEAAGVPKSVVGLVTPLGYSFNLEGSNIYITLAALFIAQALGIDLSFGDQLLLLGVAVLSSKGGAGVTGAGFITLAATLSMVQSVPVAGMALILGVDRFMSECRAITSFIGNAVATLVVARWDGSLDRERLAEVLRAPGSAPAIPALGREPDL